MNYLSVENLSKSYAGKLLFQEITFGLSKGDKTGLIARNGAGKSTLLKIIAGKDFKDSGNVVVKNGVKVAYLPQLPRFDSYDSVENFVKKAGLQVTLIISEYNKAIERQAVNDTPEVRKSVGRLANLMDRFNAWDFDRKMKEMLYRFGIQKLDQKVNTLSGGQQKRLALAMLLLDNPDFLLLDEPTNHLDIEMIEWLENFLSSANITLLMVTHDRYFLDKICNTILELDGGKLYSYKGNYAFFLEKRTERIQKRGIEIGKAAKRLKKELEWMRKMPKARTHKSKARIDAFYQIKDKASERVGEAEIKLEVNMQRLGGKILELKNVSKSYGDIKIVENFSYIFKKGERVGIIGKNGAGKSTFLNVIAGIEPPGSGTVIKGDTIVTGYYTQKGLQVSGEKRIIDVVKDIAEVIVLDKNRQMTASQFLNYFLFPPAMQIQPVSKLSGGEMRRLYLLTVLVKNPNFLILDEPTNDLDIVTLNKLEEFLSEYKGCLILVSHDRYFLDRLTDHLFVFEGEGKIEDFYGNFTAYKLSKESENVKKRIGVKEADKAASGKMHKRKGLSYKEKLEYERLEKEIELLEKEKVEMEKTLLQTGGDYLKLNEISKKIGLLIDEIDEKTMRWLELDEKKNS
jgi:ATP-binding cassette subfamily F protein uup